MMMGLSPIYLVDLNITLSELDSYFNLKKNSKSKNISVFILKREVSFIRIV